MTQLQQNILFATIICHYAALINITIIFIQHIDFFSI